MISYAGFLLVPLGHGGVIQPSCAALGGLLLATLVLKEKLPAQRAIGAAIIVAGLVVIGGEALATIGTHGLLGDFSFAVAGLMFAVFGMLLRLWRITPMRAVAITSVVSLVYLPVQWLFFGFERMIALGPLREPAAGGGAGHLRGRRGDLSVHPLGGLARSRTRRGVSVAGAGLHPADRIRCCSARCRAGRSFSALRSCLSDFAWRRRGEPLIPGRHTCRRSAGTATSRS